MEMKETAMKCIGAMDSIILRPHVTMGMSTQNKKTGECTGPKSLSLSVSTTLWRVILALLTLCLAMKAAMCLFRMKERRKIKKKYQAKRRWRKKK